MYIAKGDGSYSKLAPANYAVSRDSSTERTVVTLKAAYIKTLADKTTYKIMFVTGTDLDNTKPETARQGTFKVSASPKLIEKSPLIQRR